ncbi:MAG: gamma carbonic anhydrase family protein [Tissierellia bacterium]|nr:gamma carbonic anhydrase family protein [Tissierellia bacterium]
MKEYHKNTFEGIGPSFHENSFVASGAEIKGDVRMEEFSSVWHNVSARGDVNFISIGKYTNVQDNSVLHVSDDYSCVIGDYVTIGHGAIIHACTIEDHCLIGMGAIVLDGAVIGRGSIVAAGSVVTKGTIIPPHSLVIGTPGKVVKSIEEEMEHIHAQAVKYKTLWTEGYGILPNAGGEVYHGEEIV